MNQLRLLTTLFTSLNNPTGIPFWILSPIRKSIRAIANKSLPHYLSKPIAYSRDIDENIIVSLTSYPGRIGVVWQVVETLKRQSLRPKKIILWLSKQQFPNEDDIPINLRSLIDEVFVIRMVEEDIKSHKKYYYAMRDYPFNTIITFDDDIYYHPDLVKELVKTSKRCPHCIVANVTNQLQYKDDKLKPYKEWGRHFKPFSSFNRVQIGVGGVLYPPNSLNKLVFRKDLFTILAPLADDLWLNTMARLEKTPVVQTNFHYLWMEIKTNALSLTSINNGRDNMNDKQLNQIRAYLKKEGLEDVYAAGYNVGIDFVEKK